MQSRDILDTVVSLKDHIDRAPQQPWVLLPSGETGASWTRLEDEEKYWAIALYYAPWHCQFVTSWETEVGRFEVTYERLTTEPAKVLQEICERFEMPGTAQEAVRAVDLVAGNTRRTNFNVGVGGRGAKLLPFELQQFVQEMEARSKVLQSQLSSEK